MFRSLFLHLALAASLAAQSGLDKSLIFAGTTATSGPDTHAWLIWHPTDPLFISTHSLAIYRKNGGVASTATFTRISIVEPSADTRLIESLLPVAQKLGQNMTDLDTMLTDMLGDAAPASGVTIAQRLSALIAAAHGNAENTQRLILLGRQHPAVALALGIAIADPIPAAATRTYELREYDRFTDTDISVLGRVTLDAASILVLPQTGRPFEVEDPSSKGDLNVALRWSTPNNLRDLSPLHYGYDVYRVPLPEATAHGWIAAPPATTSLLKSEPKTVKVNNLAILPPKILYGPEASDINDKTTVFVLDDNDRFDAGAKFTDGLQFAYFVVARDLLGRGGQPSEAREVTIKDRMPPNPPQKVQVRNVTNYDGTNRHQRFHITWEAPDLPPGETISGWYVYRWRTPKELTTKGLVLDPVTNLPDKNLIAILPPFPLSFTDNGTVTPPSWTEVDELPPEAPDDTSTTYFYTLRAIDGSLSQNYSGHSAPAWGVLRDREGPAGVDGGFNLTVCLPSLVFDSFTQVPLPKLTNDQGHFLLTCAATPADGWDWAEFEMVGNGSTMLGRAQFRKTISGQMVAVLRKTIPNYGGLFIFRCRVGTENGRVSAWVSSPDNSPAPQNDRYILALWNATLNKIVTAGPAGDWQHDAVDPATGTTTELGGKFTPSPGARKYKVYRRVNNSEQTLIASGEILPTDTSITWTDPNPVAGNCTVCYYLQLLDEHGNPGPLVQQGECIRHGDATYLPTPILEPISALPGVPLRMKVNFFSNIAGTERFEVWVARSSGNLPGSLNSHLSNDLVSTHPNVLTDVDGTQGLDFSVFQTGLARHLNTDGSPEFSFNLPVSLTDAYTVMVRAVGPGKFGERMAGAFSNVETFSYAMRKIGLDARVPWPDRPLPPKSTFHPGVSAIHLGSGPLSPWKGNLVRIGEYADYSENQLDGTEIQSPDINNPTVIRIYHIATLKDVEEHLYRHDGVALAEPKEAIPGIILPIALYRVQVPSTYFPVVPGDVVQVSPLMEKIAQFEQVLFGSNVTTVTDPFIAILPAAVTGLPRTIATSEQDILLMDRQPVIQGARYKYLLVRFGPNKEIERVIVTNEVDIPL
jgi:hypothetical protein